MRGLALVPGGPTVGNHQPGGRHAGVSAGCAIGRHAAVYNTSTHHGVIQLRCMAMR